MRLGKLAAFKPLPVLVGPGECGAADAVLLESVTLPDDTKVTFAPAATLRCTMAEQVALWLREDILPASASLGTQMRVLEDYNSYECRGQNRVRGATLSEHGRANALDLRGFKLANGKMVELTDVNVAKEWRESLRASACVRFHTVLGPGSDGNHETHIHVDLAERRSGYKICQWDVREPVKVAEKAKPETEEKAKPAAEEKGKPGAEEKGKTAAGEKGKPAVEEKAKPVVEAKAAPAAETKATPELGKKTKPVVEAKAAPAAETKARGGENRVSKRKPRRQPKRKPRRSLGRKQSRSPKKRRSPSLKRKRPPSSSRCCRFRGRATPQPTSHVCRPPPTQRNNHVLPQSRPSRRRATSRGGAGVTIDGGGEEGPAGKTPYFPIMTSEALMTAQASSPFFS